MSIRSLHLTKPFVTHLACARSAPNSFAGETNVIVTARNPSWEKAAHSGQSDHRFRLIPATGSGLIRPPIPAQKGHPL